MKTDYNHFFRVSWNTRTRYSDRHYSREFKTREEAISKARQIKEKNIYASGIRVFEEETWNTPDPLPNGTLHVRILEWNIPWWMEADRADIKKAWDELGKAIQINF